MDYKESIDAFVSLVRDCNRVVLTCHKNADGDALGSTLGMRRVLMNMGKVADVIIPDNAPSTLSYIAGYNYVITNNYDKNREACDAILDQADLLIMMDFNAYDRVGSLSEKLQSITAKRILIDHHLYPSMSPDVTFSFPECAATCELAVKILCDAGLEDYMDREAATDFYIGIMTDTGELSYNSSNPELYELVAHLLRKNVDKVFVHENIAQKKSLHQLKLRGFALCHKLKRVEQYSPFLYIALTQKELDQYHYMSGDTEGLVNIPLELKGSMASALFSEKPEPDHPDHIHISFRSKYNFPINEFAQQYFNGGGHEMAAGGRFYGKLEDAVELYKSKIVDFHKRWMKRTAK